MSLHRAASVAAILVVVGGPTLVACGSDPHSSGSGGSGDSQFGQVRAELAATGPDGANYTLSGESLAITLTGSDAGSQVLTFNPALATESFSLAAGSYQGTLIGADPNHAQEFPLIRLTDAGQNNVFAALKNVQPISFTITSGATTNLTFQFQLVGVGNVTFGTGTLDTAISVAAAEGGTASSGTEQGTAVLNQIDATFTGGMPPAMLSSTLNQGLPANFPFNFNFTLAGPFVAGVDSACAPINVPSQCQPKTGVPADDMFVEATGGQANLCFYDSNGFTMPTSWGLKSGTPFIGPWPNAAVIFLTNTKLSSMVCSTQLAPALTNGSSPTFADYIVATTSTPIYDGTTANLAQLAQAVNLTPQAFFTAYDPGQLDEVVVSSLAPLPAIATVSLTLSP